MGLTSSPHDGDRTGTVTPFDHATLFAAFDRVRATLKLGK
jgi:hypothetical protein